MSSGGESGGAGISAETGSGSECWKIFAGVLEGDGGTPFGGEPIRQHNEEQANRLLGQGLELLGLKEADLEKMPKNSPE